MKQEPSAARSSTLCFVRAQRLHRAIMALATSLGLALAFLFGLSVVSASPADPSDPAHGYVIVQFDDHNLVARAITFTAPISGLHALELSGLEVITANYTFGTAVCSIGGVGCPADDCFCGGSTYWGYKYWEGSAWQDYMVGAGDSLLNDGAIEGWRWGEWGSEMWPAQPATAALHALDWLRPEQSLTDGGYGGDSSSAEALLSVGANGYLASEWRRQTGAPSLADYWLVRASAYSTTGGAQAGKLAVGMSAAQTCWPHSSLRPGAYYDAASGAYATGAGPQAWAILGTVALTESVPAQAIDYLKSLIQPNGGWEWGPGWGADTNATALALQALIAAGEPLASAEITQGLAYLKAAQNADGGFPYSPEPPGSSASDANSTAYVMQALRAAEEDPSGPAWSMGSSNPITFLLSLQLPDGSFEWKQGQGSNQLATQQAAVALLGNAFPLRMAQATQCPTRFLPIVHR
jgi:hypothetical protein